jgi:hypothetical protein
MARAERSGAVRSPPERIRRDPRHRPRARHHGRLGSEPASTARLEPSGWGTPVILTPRATADEVPSPPAPTPSPATPRAPLHRRRSSKRKRPHRPPNEVASTHWCAAWQPQPNNRCATAEPTEERTDACSEKRWWRCSPWLQRTIPEQAESVTRIPLATQKSRRSVLLVRRPGSEPRSAVDCRVAAQAAMEHPLGVS